jgi:hypothetical protein
VPLAGSTIAQTGENGAKIRESLPGSTAIETACWILQKRKEAAMDGSMIVRVVAGVLFVIVLVVLIQRRRTRVK